MGAAWTYTVCPILIESGSTAKLDERFPILMANSGYVLHRDRFMPTDVEYETNRYFVDKGLEMGTYK